MAGRARAHPDVVQAGRGEAELRVKGGYAENIVFREAKMLGDCLDCFRGQILLLILDILQQGDEVVTGRGVAGKKKEA